MKLLFQQACLRPDVCSDDSRIGFMDKPADKFTDARGLEDRIGIRNHGNLFLNELECVSNLVGFSAGFIHAHKPDILPAVYFSLDIIHRSVR